jgi:hypothetical protein
MAPRQSPVYPPIHFLKYLAKLNATYTTGIIASKNCQLIKTNGSNAVTAGTTKNKIDGLRLATGFDLLPSGSVT